MINKAILMGRLTRDPELRTTQSGTPVTSFTLAVDRGVKRTGDPNQITTDFINIVAWSHTADFVVKYFSKGQLVAVVGRLQIRKWTDNEGRTRDVAEVIADEVHFAEPKRDSYGGGSPSPYGERPASRPSQSAEQAVPSDDGFDEIAGDSDELPF